MSTKRETILLSAEHRFYAAGFHATGIDDIVADSKTTKTTLYRNFPSKTALVVATIEKRDREYMDYLAAGVPAANRGLGAFVLAIVHRHADWLTHDTFRGCYFIKALGEFIEHEPAIVRAVTDHKQRLRQFLLDNLAAAGHPQPEKASLDLTIALEGATQTALSFDPSLITERLKAQVCLLLGIGEAS